MVYVRPNSATRDLRKAVREGDTAGVISALARGADPNEKDAHDAPPLLNAVTAGNVAVVKTLLAHGADPNLPLWGAADNTILMWAVRLGTSECILALVAARADVSDWLFQAAAERGMNDVLRAMLDGGADVNAVSSSGTALMAAAYRGNTATVRLLLDTNADPNTGTMNGWMPLMSASAMGHTEVVRLLLAAGAHPWAKDKDGDTALKFAEESGHSEVVQVLRRVSV